MEIQIEHPQVKLEFERWHKHFGEHDPYSANGNIGIIDVLRDHFLIADHFYRKGEGMGGIGPKDPHLLHSAVYRQFTAFDGREKWETSYERCATLVFGLIKDHPFHDANKRTALLVLIYFLDRTKRAPTIKKKELEDFVVDIAEDKLRKYRRLQSLEAKTDDPEIKFIADFLRRNSRIVDKSYRTITYKELDMCLREFGHCLDHPRNNFINVCRIENVRALLGFGKLRKELFTVAQIGFPGWKRQVDRNCISYVRKETGLTQEKGFDSEAFYSGGDSLHALIEEYAQPLERLAHR